MARRVLITGVDGFTGRHLVAHLREFPDLEVFGAGRRAQGSAALDGYRHCDVTDRASVDATVRWARPDVVYHLAGLWGDAAEQDLIRVNVDAFEHVRDSLRGFARTRTIRMLVVGSAAEIGAVPKGQLPVDEAVACRPLTAYGRSKHALVRAAVAEPAGSGLEIIVARTFNLVGPGLDDRLALGAFVAQVRRAKRGGLQSIHCGWLDGRRDYLDVADAVQAYRRLADRGPAGQIVNVCSGRSHRMRDLLERLMSLAGVQVPVIAAGRRAHDVADMRGSCRRLSDTTGWRPRVGLEESLAALWSPYALE